VTKSLCSVLGNSAKMVSKGLLMTMTTEKRNDALEVSIKLTNKLPHNFPTGAPFRNVYIKDSNNLRCD
jgi:hypothetical protein